MEEYPEMKQQLLVQKYKELESELNASLKNFPPKAKFKDIMSPPAQKQK